MAITLKDIAKIAGVSESTVSRCLNDSPLVSKKTMSRVKKIAEEYNFQCNINARNLANKKTKRIGIIFPDGFYKFNMRDFFSSLEEHLLKGVEEQNYEAVVYTLNSRSRVKSNIKRLTNGREVDGLLIACRDIPIEDIEALKRNKIPHTLVYYKPNKYWGPMKLFTNDNVYSGYLATQYLIENGCKKIAVITSDDKQLKNYSQRTIGYLKAIRESKLKIEKDYIIKDIMDFKTGERLAFEKVNFFKTIDGVVCQQDKVALGLIKGLIKQGFSIPEDISIIGHDNLEIVDFFDPKLTTVQQPFKNICENAVIDLFDQINGVDKKVRRIFKSNIVERETVKTNF
ncbi:LacI family DNA-binding transcriptional regulator [Psychrilyobacter atlanticus]|uniref:LacI family DNA-binding transcriptional regulator n=1 Tax=Psychrilyobacter atlanticus TaxID=271091 RepID=UPI000422E5A6|nr:LacI family DNA-binding transcriptional regulator [Psychrilyobacter atlanticus]